MLGQAREGKNRQILPSAVLEAGGQGRTWAARDISSSPGAMGTGTAAGDKGNPLLQARPATNLGILSNTQSQDTQESGHRWSGAT